MKIATLMLWSSYLLMSCVKEKNTYTNSYFENKSEHSVRVQAFQNGTVISTASFALQPGELKKVYHDNSRGLNKGTSFGNINFPIDSFVVTFDNIYQITHYKPNLIGNNPKRYLFSSKRNIYNDSSYQMSIKRQSKSEKEVEFDYEFTNKDYTDAK